MKNSMLEEKQVICQEPVSQKLKKLMILNQIQMRKFTCTGPEFHDFNKGREESCFAVGQIWVCYDSLDVMPRLYAQVRKVNSPGFGLQITWLEAVTEDEGETN
ncbi:uncharacterized protein LOC111375921 [Olea europaea var. sylvestris]|uniref:uncharacterized protein LOC111375921 n=1 Tax=Olea europaea var. sylvestris TaxID=158386 RepID=UPI000C1D6E14|nr:uncharacterized protein LOC111375921 [Olea europaea var. sylvestris]